MRDQNKKTASPKTSKNSKENGVGVKMVGKEETRGAGQNDTTIIICK